MRVALTVCISMRSLSRQFALLLAATAALASVACSGANDQPTYTSTDVEVGATADAPKRLLTRSILCGDVADLALELRKPPPSLDIVESDRVGF